MREREEDRENKLFNHPLWLTCCSLWENPKPKIQFINFSFELFFFFFGFVSTKLCLMVWNLIKLCSVSVCVCVQVAQWISRSAALWFIECSKYEVRMHSSASSVFYCCCYSVKLSEFHLSFKLHTHCMLCTQREYTRVSWQVVCGFLYSLRGIWRHINEKEGVPWAYRKFYCVEGCYFLWLFQY